MITKPQTKKLKNFLKNDYVEDVLAILKANNVLTRNNTPYSESSIRMVFNGKLENIDIEDAILKVYANRKQEHEDRESIKAKLLSA